MYSVSGKESSCDSPLNSSFLNLNTAYTIMGFIILHCYRGLSFLQSFPTELDLNKAGLLFLRNTLGMHYAFIRHCYPTLTRDTGGPQVLHQTV